jgi:hypothetical protein
MIRMDVEDVHSTGATRAAVRTQRGDRQIAHPDGLLDQSP